MAGETETHSARNTRRETKKTRVRKVCGPATPVRLSFAPSLLSKPCKPTSEPILDNRGPSCSPTAPPAMRAGARQAASPRAPPSVAQPARHRPTPRRPPHPAAWWSSLFGGGSDADATATKRQLPAAVDDADLPFPRALLAGTHVAARPLALAYRASRDGWSALDFHAACDFMGPLIVLCTTDGSEGGGPVKFGGFHSTGVSSSDDYFASLSPFLFVLDARGTGFTRLPKINGPEAALYDYRRGGPQWGADALVVGAPAAPVMGGFAGPDSPTVGAGDLKQARSRLGLAYAAREDGRTLFGGDASVDGGRARVTLAEVEAWCAPDVAALY